MPPVRRSTRLKKVKAESAEVLSPPVIRRKRNNTQEQMAEEMKRYNTRQSKRRETLPPGQLTPATFMKLLGSLPSTITGLMSDDPVSQLDSTTKLFKLLSAENQQPPVDDIVRSGAVPRLIEFLKLDDYQLLQVEAARVLKNFGTNSPENTKIMVDHGVAPLLVKLIESSNDQIKEQALCALGNIAADSPAYCSLILTCGALNPLLAQLNEHDNLSLLRTGAWTVTNLCGGTPQAQMEQLNPAIPVLASLLSTKDDTVLIEACWGLSYLFKGGLTQDPDIFTATTCQKTLELVKHPSPAVVCRSIMFFLSILNNEELVKHAFACRVHHRLLEFGSPPSKCIYAVARRTIDEFMDRVLCIPYETLRSFCRSSPVWLGSKG